MSSPTADDAFPRAVEEDTSPPSSRSLSSALSLASLSWSALAAMSIVNEGGRGRRGQNNVIRRIIIMTETVIVIYKETVDDDLLICDDDDTITEPSLRHGARCLECRAILSSIRSVVVR